MVSCVHTMPIYSIHCFDRINIRELRVQGILRLFHFCFRNYFVLAQAIVEHQICIPSSLWRK